MAIYQSNYTKDEIDEGVGLGLSSPLNIYKSIVAAICASSIDGFTVTETTNAEWDYVLTDSEDRIIAGIRTDGSLFVADIDSRGTMGSYTIAQINTAVSLANSAYQKPQGGIPASDLANDVIPGDFGASGTNHAHGLVPDPGATQGNTKYLREDGTWATPAGLDISGKEDKMTVVTQSSGTTLTAAIGNYYRFTYDVGTLDITLPTPTGSNAQSILFFMTTGASPAVTFTSTGNTIYKNDGFAIDATTTYEINALWNGGAWVINAVKYTT